MVASFFMLGVFTRDYRLYWNHLPWAVTEKKKTRFAIFLFFFALCGQIIVSFFVFGMANLRQESDINYRYGLVTFVTQLVTPLCLSPPKITYSIDPKRPESSLF